jgi:O-antigen ligase
MKDWKKLPILVWVVILSTFIACVGGASFMGYNITGIAWIVPLLFSLLAFITERGRVRFPVGIWLPWIVLVVLYLSVAEAPNALQRSIMILCPIIVGMAVSKLRVNMVILQGFYQALRMLAVALWVMVVLKTGIYLSGRLPDVTGLAAEVMTASLLANYFVTRYILQQRSDLSWWAALAAIPIVAVTRTGIAVVGLTYPLALAPLKIRKRVLILLVVGCLGVVLFYSERIQHKMFFSGHGTFADLNLDNPDFRTTGRITMWDRMVPAIEERPFLGYGANASEPFVSSFTGGLVHPHNDWLRLAFDYGYLGCVVFGVSLLAQVRHSLVRARKNRGQARILFYAGASSFVSFFLFMFSDNIILYAAFFGNLQFTMLGMAYAAQKQQKVFSPSTTAPILR